MDSFRGGKTMLSANNGFENQSLFPFPDSSPCQNHSPVLFVKSAMRATGACPYKYLFLSSHTAVYQFSGSAETIGVS